MTKRIKNSSVAEEAKELSRNFSGHDNEGYTEYLTQRGIPKDLAEIGILIELQIWSAVNYEEYVPIRFAPETPNLEDEDNVLIGGINKGDKSYLYLLGGDQVYDSEIPELLNKLDYSPSAIKELVKLSDVPLGQLKSIAYYKAKHHLDGEPKKAIVREHQFCENDEGEIDGDSEFPILVYSKKFQEFKIMGGSFSIEPEGIAG